MEEKKNTHCSQRCYKFSCKEKNQQHDRTKTVIFSELKALNFGLLNNPDKRSLSVVFSMKINQHNAINSLNYF